MKKKYPRASGINIYLGVEDEKARRLASLAKLADKLGVSGIHRDGKSHGALICTLADLPTDDLANAIGLVMKSAKI